MRVRCGDIVFMLNGIWYGYGNFDFDLIIWVDMFDWLLMDYFGCVWMWGDVDEMCDVVDFEVDFF